MKRIRTLALIAHDSQKPALKKWAKKRLARLKSLNLVATGTTGTVLEKALHLKIKKYKSGPLGGDQQIGAKIVEGEVDALIFFWDPLAPQPHDVDVKALLRIAVVYDVPVACNPSTADFLIRG